MGGGGVILGRDTEVDSRLLDQSLHASSVERTGRREHDREGYLLPPG